MLDLELYKQAVCDSRDGIVIAEAKKDNMVIFANAAFEQLTGFPLEKILGKNCRFLQADDRAQPQIYIIKKALENGEHCLVTLRNYRKNGDMFWNELSISPVHNKLGKLTHFIGIQKDVTAREIFLQQLKTQTKAQQVENQHLALLANTDPLTGIYNQRYFKHQLLAAWNITRRLKVNLALFMLDIDYFKKFNDTYGHPAGDACLKAVSKTLTHTFKRSSDFCARMGGEEFALLATDMTQTQAHALAEELCEKIRALNIPHAASDICDVITISVGGTVLSPDDTISMDDLITRADQALYIAKKQGRNQAVML